MNTLQLIKKYGHKVTPKILSGYKHPDRYLFVNEDDRDLTPIRIEIPKCPEYHRIDGFGKPAQEQKFEPPQLPARIKSLQKKFETIDEVHEELQQHPELYEEEIKFIKKQWYYRLHGYWFFNNGKPTYIDGWHHFYISWWRIDVGLPKYRDRDRKFFMFARMCYNETRTFKIINENGDAIQNDKGYYDFEDTGSRVFYGFNYPKHRREGATYKAECINYELISRTKAAWGGIQSMTDKQSKKCFIKHLVSPWKKLPFFFKPSYEGSTSPKSELSFSPPSIRLSNKGSLVSSDIGLESMINFDAADPSAYDGDKLYFHHDDEVGKLKKGLSCWERHLVVKECLSMGSEIIGFTIKTSTVGEMERGGGKAFKHQCQMSDYFVRNPNGQTRSGLLTLFIPAYEGLQGFIDEYGNSVIDTPTPEQSKYIKKKIGAKEFLLNSRKGYIDSGDNEGLSEQVRLYPIKFTECFRTAAKDSGFNMQKLESYIDNLRFRKESELPVRGNFEWVKNQRDTKVEFVLNKNGKFLVSHVLDTHESNRKFWNDEISSWVPLNVQYGAAGADPFRFNKTEHNRKSNGGGAVVRKGILRDGNFAMKRKVVCTYSNRTYDKYTYAEDMLKMCVYYGVKMNPEINVELIWDYFDERGYGGFLMYRYDPKVQKLAKTPGSNTNDKIKQSIFGEFMQYIENEGDDDNHIEVFEEARDIAGIEDMTNFDLFTAVGYAFLGTLPNFDDYEEVEDEGDDLSRYVKKRVY